jgi:hypothetical protein
MAKNKTEQGEQVENVAAEQTVNYTLHYRTKHPKHRCSYGVAGVAGIVVIDLNLLDGWDGQEIGPDYMPPETITISLPLKQPRAKATATDRSAEVAARAAERAAKQIERIAAAQKRAEDQLAAAQAKVEAAKAKLAPKSEDPASA